MANEYYRLGIGDRRRMLADLGFVRDEDRIWRHDDGRAIGEGVVAALVDVALLRYLGVDSSKLKITKRPAAKNQRRRRDSSRV